MPTVQDVIRGAYALTSAEPNFPAGLRWFSSRFDELASYAKPRFLRKVGVMTVAAPITTGTVTLAQGDSTVTGDTDARTAWQAAHVGGTLIGRFFQGATCWYEIVGVVPSTYDLLLATPYTETDLAAGSSYRVVQRFPVLEREVRLISTIYNPRLRNPLAIVGLAEFDLRNPEREYAESTADLAIEHGENDDGSKRIELYPYSTQDEHYPFTYFAKSPTWQLDTPLPGFLDEHIIRTGILVDIYGMKAAMAADAGKVDIAAFWLNTQSRQETRWMTAMERAFKDDRGLDDVSLLVANSRSFGSTGTNEIRTAREWWETRGGTLR